MLYLFIFLILILIGYYLERFCFTSKRGRDMQSGELIVVGQDQVSINLKKHPSCVVVKFIGDENIIPCNPQHSDYLEWEIVHLKTFLKKKHQLVVKWGVTSIRKIAWEVYY